MFIERSYWQLSDIFCITSFMSFCIATTGEGLLGALLGTVLSGELLNLLLLAGDKLKLCDKLLIADWVIKTGNSPEKGNLNPDDVTTLLENLIRLKGSPSVSHERWEILFCCCWQQRVRWRHRIQGIPVETGQPHHLLPSDWLVAYSGKTLWNWGARKRKMLHHVVMDAVAIETVHCEKFLEVEDFPLNICVFPSLI